MGGEDGRQTNRTVSIQHEHALSVNNIDQGILKDKGGRRGKRAKLTIYVSVFTHAN